ncbi:MAG TPA: cation transporter [Lentibacillus sp.]|uniref:heavy-metal-associated domain-containing protein n=1 Tax=Lentibacillus sp. TaxID=1925746 RepID=UPI002B4AAFEA|nr:cation transporter [Lentibacillus sp.]HLR63582.1 cation transporter [Lentibacillus sp.]
MRKIEFQLEPLSCPSCIKRIEGTLNKQKGVKDARVLFNSSKVKAMYDESVATPEELVAIIEKLGYPVKKTKAA